MLGESGDLVSGRLPAEHAGTRLRECLDIVGGIVGRPLLRASVVSGAAAVVVVPQVAGAGLPAPGLHLVGFLVLRGPVQEFGARSLEEVRVLLADLAARVPSGLPAADRGRADPERPGHLGTGEVHALPQGPALLGAGQRNLVPGGGEQGVDRLEIRHRVDSSRARGRTTAGRRPGDRRRPSGSASEARVGPDSRSSTSMPKWAATASQSSRLHAAAPD